MSEHWLDGVPISGADILNPTPFAPRPERVVVVRASEVEVPHCTVRFEHGEMVAVQHIPKGIRAVDGPDENAYVVAVEDDEEEGDEELLDDFLADVVMLQLGISPSVEVEDHDEGRSSEVIE